MAKCSAPLLGCCSSSSGFAPLQIHQVQQVDASRTTCARSIQVKCSSKTKTSDKNGFDNKGQAWGVPGRRARRASQLSTLRRISARTCQNTKPRPWHKLRRISVAKYSADKRYFLQILPSAYPMASLRFKVPVPDSNCHASNYLGIAGSSSQ